MSCIDCKCKQLKLDEHICRNLHEMNDSNVKGGSHALADAPLCDYPKIFPKIMYSVWCVLKNIIAVICWLITRIDELERRVNAICATLKCVIEYLKRENEKAIAEALGNVEFSMRGTGTASQTAEGGGITYTKVDTTPDGSFVISWNMVTDAEVGRGRVTGRVNHSYTTNDDGTIQYSIQSVVINAVNYQGNLGGWGYPGNADAGFTIYDGNKNTIWHKTYNPYTSWSESVNKTVQIGKSGKLQPNGGDSGGIKVLSTFDDWNANDTFSDIQVVYTNNNQPVVQFSCPDPKC